MTEQLSSADGRCAQLSALANSLDPSEFQQAFEKYRAQNTGKVRPALTPVQARSAQEPATSTADLVEIDIDLREQDTPPIGQFTFAVRQAQRLRAGQGVGYRDTETAGNVIVASARLLQLRRHARHCMPPR